MKEFIIYTLSMVGLGVNSYVERISDYGQSFKKVFPEYNAQVNGVKEDSFTLVVSKGESVVKVHYTLKNKRVTSISIL